MKKILVIALFLGACTTIWANPKPIKKPIFQKSIVADSLDEYLGEYKMSEYFATYKVTKDGGFLYAEADSYGNNKLIKQKEADTFVSTSSYGTTVTFLRDATTKKVTGVKLLLQGNEVIGKK
jgi:Domain of unknown function (DUF3471)